MTEKKAREDYKNEYEFKRENLWKVLSQNDCIGYENTISFFRLRKQGETLNLQRTVNEEGHSCLKVQHIPDKVYEYSKVVGIQYCVNAIKEKMLTKGGKTRKSIESLPAYTLRELENLFHYIMQEYVTYSNRGNIELTYQEWCLLFKPLKKK